MKRIISFLVSSLVLGACSDQLEENLPQTQEIQTKSIEMDSNCQIVNYCGDMCVKFSDKENFMLQMENFRKMSSDEIAQKVWGMGFISQKDIMEEADLIQQEIVDNFEKNPDQPWPYQKINDFKNKYGDIFLFNPIDSTDFVAHYKIKNPFYSFITNRKGFFLIGDSVVKVPVYRNAEEYFGFSHTTFDSATNENTSTNVAESRYQIPNGDDVKVRATLLFDNNASYRMVGTEYYSKKKKILWKRHHATIHLRINAKGTGKDGFEIYNLSTHQYDKLNNKTFMIFQDTYGTYTRFWGRFGEQPYPSGPVIGTFPRFNLTGKMEIWSNEIPESKRGSAKIYYNQNW